MSKTNATVSKPYLNFLGMVKTWSSSSPICLDISISLLCLLFNCLHLEVKIYRLKDVHRYYILKFRIQVHLDNEVENNA